MLIGDVGLATRSMCRNRSGRPSSMVRNAPPAYALPAAASLAVRASDRRPVACATAPTIARAPDSSPRKR